ncbi:MAG: DUF6580 family putative transport protein [Pirellulales bacterium]
MKQTTKVTVSVFALLIILGAVGRLAQPAWCFTPLAAVTLFAGYFLASPLVAALVPLSILGITDWWLPGYSSHGVMLAVYAAALFPVLLGRFLRRRPNATRLAATALLPAVVFWLTTNLGVWLFQEMYPKSVSGLIACYVAAIPFFRNMLAGDVFYVGVVFGCAYLATLPSPMRARVRIVARNG